MMTRNEFGRHVEDLFSTECLARGVVAVKSHPQSPHDFTIRAANRELRIQVKGVRSLRKHATLPPHFRVRCQRKDKARTTFFDSGIDFMAVFVEPLARWHIFAPPNISAHLDIYRNPTGRMFEAINRWDLLGCNCKNDTQPKIVKSDLPKFHFCGGSG